VEEKKKKKMMMLRTSGGLFCNELTRSVTSSSALQPLVGFGFLTNLLQPALSPTLPLQPLTAHHKVHHHRTISPSTLF
jgi:hypothetical protein